MSDSDLIKLDAATKRKLMSHIGALPEGVYHFELRRARPRHSDDQREYFYAGPVTSFARFMMQHDAELTKAHAKTAAELRLKEMFLEPRPVPGPGGVVIATLPPSIKELDTAQMTQLIDRCNAWLLREWGIIVLTPEEYFASLREQNKGRSRGRNAQNVANA